MTNKIEFAISGVLGFATSALVSNHLLEQMAMKSIIAVMTGFFGAMAGLFAKFLFNKMRDNFSKNNDGVEK